MSDSTPSSKASNVFFAAGLFLVFGFLVLILSNFAEQNSLEERAYMGDFDQATIDTRWENLKAVKEAQSGLFSEEKVAKAMAAVASAEAKPAPTDIVVPGSPTFLKQMEAPAEEAKPAGDSKPAEAPESSEPAKVPAPGESAAPEAAPKAAAPAPAEQAAPNPEEKKAAEGANGKPDQPKAQEPKPETPAQQ